jgi:hypothetical protein
MDVIIDGGPLTAAFLRRFGGIDALCTQCVSRVNVLGFSVGDGLRALGRVAFL